MGPLFAYCLGSIISLEKVRLWNVCLSLIHSVTFQRHFDVSYSEMTYTLAPDYNVDLKRLLRDYDTVQVIPRPFWGHLPIYSIYKPSYTHLLNK